MPKVQKWAWSPLLVSLSHDYEHFLNQTNFRTMFLVSKNTYFDVKYGKYYDFFNIVMGVPKAENRHGHNTLSYFTIT